MKRIDWEFLLVNAVLAVIGVALICFGVSRFTGGC